MIKLKIEVVPNDLSPLEVVNQLNDFLDDLLKNPFHDGASLTAISGYSISQEFETVLNELKLLSAGGDCKT